MLNQQAKVVRSLLVSPDMTITENTEDTSLFWCSLQPPRVTQQRSIGSPRTDLQPYLLRYGARSFAPKVDIHAGTQVLLEGTIYECLSEPDNRLWSVMQAGYEAQVLPVSVLYPFRCAIVDKGGSSSTPQDVPIAIWSPTEDTRDRGSYVTYQAYVSAIYHNLLDINSEVLIGNKRFTVTRESLDVSSGIVSLTLRGTGRG